MSDDIQHPEPPETFEYTIRLVYKKSRQQYLFIIEALSETEAYAIYNALGYPKDRKYYDITIAKALLIPKEILAKLNGPTNTTPRPFVKSASR